MCPSERLALGTVSKETTIVSSIWSGRVYFDVSTWSTARTRSGNLFVLIFSDRYTKLTWAIFVKIVPNTYSRSACWPLGHPVCRTDEFIDRSWTAFFLYVLYIRLWIPTRPTFDDKHLTSAHQWTGETIQQVHSRPALQLCGQTSDRLGSVCSTTGVRLQRSRTLSGGNDIIQPLGVSSPAWTNLVGSSNFHTNGYVDTAQS